MIASRKLFSLFLNLTDISNKKLMKALTLGGFEVIALPDFSKINIGVKVVRVESFTTHWKLTSLRVVKINDGENIHTVICGDNKFNVKDYMLWAPPGAILQKNWKIKSRKFLDVNSVGMLCSYLDLGLVNKKNKKDELDQCLSISPSQAEYKKVQLGSPHPLKYFGFDDFYFNIDILPANDDFNSIYNLSKFLSRLWHLKFNETPKANLSKLELKIELNTKTKSNLFQGFMQLKNTSKFPIPIWLKSFFQVFSVFYTNNLNLITELFNILYGTKIKIYEIDKKLENITLNKQKYYLNDKLARELTTQTTYKNVLLIFDNQNQNDFPISKNYFYAFNHFALFLQNELNFTHIQSIIKNFEDRKLVNLKTDLNFLNKIIGKNFTLTEIKQILQTRDFVITEKLSSLIITIPNDLKIRNEYELAEEIIRFYGINNLIDQPYVPIWQTSQKNIHWKLTNNLRLFLLSRNLNEIKIPLIEPNQNKEMSFIYLIKDMGKYENVFTIERVFLNNKERNLLGIVWNKTHYHNYLSKYQIDLNRFYLIAFLRGILDFFKVNLTIWSKTNLVSNLSELKINSNWNFAFGKYDEIWCENKFLGKIGVINTYQQEKKVLSYYMEIDVDWLFQLIQNNQHFNFVKRENVQKFYRDISLKYEKNIDSAIALEVNKEYFIFNNYELIIQNLKQLDSKIQKIEILDIYKNQTITLRIWKQLCTKDPTLQKNTLFNKLEKQLKKINNVKII